MKLSNVIEEFIKDMLEDSAEVELQRNELANRFNSRRKQKYYTFTNV